MECPPDAQHPPRVPRGGQRPGWTARLATGLHDWPWRQSVELRATPTSTTGACCRPVWQTAQRRPRASGQQNDQPPLRLSDPRGSLRRRTPGRDNEDHIPADGGPDQSRRQGELATHESRSGSVVTMSHVTQARVTSRCAREPRPGSSRPAAPWHTPTGPGTRGCAKLSAPPCSSSVTGPCASTPPPRPTTCMGCSPTGGAADDLDKQKCVGRPVPPVAQSSSSENYSWTGWSTPVTSSS